MTGRQELKYVIKEIVKELLIETFEDVIRDDVLENARKKIEGIKNFEMCMETHTCPKCGGNLIFEVDSLSEDNKIHIYKCNCGFLYKRSY